MPQRACRSSRALLAALLVVLHSQQASSQAGVGSWPTPALFGLTPAFADYSVLTTPPGYVSQASATAAASANATAALAGRTLRYGVAINFAPPLLGADNLFRFLSASSASYQAWAAAPPATAVLVSPLDITGQLVWIAQYIASQTGSGVEFYAVSLPTALVNASDSTFKALWALDVLGLDVALYGATVTPPRMAYMRFTADYTLYRHVLVAKRATLPVQALDRRLWLWLQPFSWDMWLALVCFLVVNSAVYMWYERSTDAVASSLLHSELKRSLTHAVSHATFLSSMSVVGTNNNVPTTTSGRIHAVVAAFSLWVVMAAYLANLASQLTTRPTPYQRVKGFNTFAYQPLCVRNNSIQLHFMATEYPNIPLQITGTTTMSMLQAVLDGTCLGGLEDELLLRWLLGPGDPSGLLCGIDYVGSPSATAYPFGLPVSAAVTDAQLAAMSSVINAGLYSGSYSSAEATYLPTSRDVCDAQLAEQNALTGGSASASLSAKDLSGILLVYAAAVAATSLGRAAKHVYRRRRGGEAARLDGKGGSTGSLSRPIPAWAPLGDDSTLETQRL